MSNRFKVALFILLPLFLAILGGTVWGLVDWLRNYGSGITPFPFFDHSITDLEFHNRYESNTFLGTLERGINWYNLSFRGGTRFGSGLGFMAGAFITMGFFKEQSVYVRTLAGVLAGAEIGGRFVLNLGSGVPLFLTGTTLGAIVGGLFMCFAGAPSKAQDLPKRELAKIS